MISDVGIAAQPFVNDVLDEDKLESGGVRDSSNQSFSVTDQMIDPPSLDLRQPRRYFKDLIRETKHRLSRKGEVRRTGGEGIGFP